ncbi:alpha beta hydrolase fold-3 domain-containing protein [Moniliophthora roreri]|uniref:Alpha/beta hydrolase fold-3 domain-containing protein n=1 Tax=Moniliophthora roreri TaxID=221103 RepID=A0A0W0EZA7_MONRR|nr:alpha beta hydrolase fold-3 domain-containing protein [Moniliophthora roreri]
MAEYSHLSKTDPEFAVVAAEIPPTPISGAPMSAAERRKNYKVNILSVLKATFDPLVPPDSEYQLTDRQIDVGGGVQILCRCVIPTLRAGEDKFPLLFWTHGGGWVIGDIEWDDSRLRIIAVERRVAIVNCEYRLAPESPFPGPVNDSFACLKYFAAHPELVSANLSKGFLVGGISAGGNLAAVLAHLACNDPFFKDKPITGQLLSIPVVLHPDAYPEE